ncbi:MAG: hypothetical protein IJA75_09800 [Oscillospiraceae bacterium]|nr:hypothetical protein [Oscillospiraceae bacterium]
MNKKAQTLFPVDNSSILFFALMKKNHANCYRFTMTLSEPVCRDTLQTAVDRIYRRFPTVIAGFLPGFFHYFQFPALQPPQVQPDPGCLNTMTREELHRCAYRVFYKDNTVSIEAFHALTDGYGAIASFTTLMAEYLRLKHGIHIPAVETVRNLEDIPTEAETGDDYLRHQEGKPLHLPSRYAYQIPGNPNPEWKVLKTTLQYPVQQIVDAAHRCGVSANTLLSGVLASTVMEIQEKKNAGTLRPVRIMVPIDLRRFFESCTLRNFIWYALPTMEPSDRELSLEELLKKFHEQFKDQTQRKRLASIMAYNVKSQLSWFFRFLPRVMKYALMRLAYRYFGESNSSVTITNLGNLKLPEQMRPFVEKLDVVLTPRVHSPYGCAVISYGGLLSINISRFCEESELETIFVRKLNSLIYEE